MNRFAALVVFVLYLVLNDPLGAQTFRNPVRIPAEYDPNEVWIGDVNGDGIPDILYEEYSPANFFEEPGSIQVLLGQGNGEYLSGLPLNLPAGVSYCRLVDVNHDKKLDLVCLQQYKDGHASIATFLGNGDGTFQSPISSADLPIAQWIAAVADLNSDSNVDLVVNDIPGRGTYILFGDGTGRFKTSAKLGFSNYVAEAAMYVMDLNGDGKPDIVSSEGPEVWLGNGDGTFNPVSQHGLFGGCAFHDMDGDGHVDAVCGAILTNAGVGGGNVTGATELAILHGNKDGSFNTKPIMAETFGDPQGGYGKFLYPIAVMDLNGDGIPDILASSSDGLTVLLGKPHLEFGQPVHYAIGFLSGDSPAIDDLEKTGLTDLVACGPHGIYISYGRKNGTFETVPAYQVAQTADEIAVADFNGDGIPDIAASGDNNIKMSFGNGNGTFKSPVALPNGSLDSSEIGPGSTLLHGDFTGHGNQDILTVGAALGGQGSYIFYGGGNGTFSSPQPVPSSVLPGVGYGEASVIDINKDGRDDILSFDSTHFYFALSNADGTFTLSTTKIPPVQGSVPSWPAFADFNHDGKLDVVYATVSDVFVLKGNGDGTFESNPTILRLPTFQDYIPNVFEVATGDFDGDGNPDIALLAQSSPGDIRTLAYVLYGKGDGTFTHAVIAGAFNLQLSAMSAIDLNNDGLCDLVFFSSNPFGNVDTAEGDGVAVLLSQPGRIFGSEMNYTGGEQQTGFAFADLNRDGYPDLLTVNGFFNTLPGNSVTELLNLGPAPVHGLPTTTTITTSDRSVVAGTPVVFTAKVTRSKMGDPAPTGSVRFADQTGVTAIVPLVEVNSTTAKATLSTSAIGIGADTMSATYSGDAVFAGSIAEVAQAVTGYHVTMKLGTSTTTTHVGGQVILSVKVSNLLGSNLADPTGYVEFRDGSMVLGSDSLGTNGTTGSYDIPTAGGVHTITAWYSGDMLHAASLASAKVTVSPSATSNIETTSR
jgi:FG-GAP-like repeat/Bacterial Ig-like domain (group 3)